MVLRHGHILCVATGVLRPNRAEPLSGAARRLADSHPECFRRFLLARMGRREVAGLAAALVERADGSERVELGLALAECGDGRGFALLEELYLRSLDRPDDKPGSVPLEWITEDTLKDRLGTEAALELRRRLIALEVVRRARRN